MEGAKAGCTMDCGTDDKKCIMVAPLPNEDCGRILAVEGAKDGCTLLAPIYDDTGKTQGGGDDKSKGTIKNTPNYNVSLRNEQRRQKKLLEETNGNENDDETSGGLNDEVTKSKWKMIMPKSGISKKPDRKIKSRGGKTKIRGAKSKIGKEPGRMNTVSSQYCLEMYFSSEARGTPLGVAKSNDIRKNK